MYLSADDYYLVLLCPTSCFGPSAPPSVDSFVPFKDTERMYCKLSRWFPYLGAIEPLNHDGWGLLQYRPIGQKAPTEILGR